MENEASRTHEAPHLDHGVIQSLDELLSGLPSYSTLDLQEQRACCAFLLLTSNGIVNNKTYDYYTEGLDDGRIASSQLVGMIYMLHTLVAAMPTDKLKSLMVRVFEHEMLAEAARLEKRVKERGS